jgi:hypothetical protein
VLGTIDAIRRDLSAGNHSCTGTRPPKTDCPAEGAFVPCTFWLIQALARSGQAAVATDLFEQALERHGASADAVHGIVDSPQGWSYCPELFAKHAAASTNAGTRSESRKVDAEATASSGKPLDLSARADGKSVMSPFGEAILEPAGAVAALAQFGHCMIGVHTVGTATVCDDVAVAGQLADMPTQLANGDRARSEHVTGFELGCRTNIEHNHITCAEPLGELVAADLFDSVAYTEIGRGKLLEVGNVRGRDVTHRGPEIGDAVAREPIEDPRPVASSGHNPGPRQQSEMVRCVRDALADLGGALLDRTLTLSEHVDDLRAVTVAEGTRDRRQRVEERVLRGPVAHVRSLAGRATIQSHA